MEVTIWPGETENSNANAYPSVLAFDAPLPAMDQAKLEDRFAARGTAPPKKQYPTCATAAPQPPHQITNSGDFPIHFYRIEFKRIDGYAYQQRWKEWHPWMADPIKPVKNLVPGPALGKPFSKEWPYPIVYDSIRAAPTHHARYEDAHIRLLEVGIPPGQGENMHGHPNPSVFANDNALTPDEFAAAMETSKRAGLPLPEDRQLDPNDPRNNLVGVPGFAPEKVLLQCYAQDPQAPHEVVSNPTLTLTGHFYRLEFKRIDGDAIKTKWKTWYPEKAQ